MPTHNIDYCIYKDIPIWKGDQYENGGIFNQKICVIGESTYGNIEDPVEYEKIKLYNILMAEDHIYSVCHNEGMGKSRLYRTNVFKTLCNIENETCGDVINFWRSIVFFNYIATQFLD